MKRAAGGRPVPSARFSGALLQRFERGLGGRVVGDDLLVVDLEQPEHGGGDEAGAVLARRAVEHEGMVGRLGDDLQHLDELGARALEQEAVEVERATSSPSRAPTARASRDR